MRTTLQADATSPGHARTVLRFNRWLGGRHPIGNLSHFSDALLNDIGLTRDTTSDAIRRRP